MSDSTGQALPDDTRTPGIEEMLLTPEQRERLHADLMEITRRRLAALDAVRYWPAPFDRVHAKDTRPWPDYDGDVVDVVGWPE